MGAGLVRGPPPGVPLGYYPYYPYACAPYGYYGPSWFSGGIFIGAGPLGLGYGWRGFYGGRGFYGRPGFGGRSYTGGGQAILVAEDTAVVLVTVTPDVPTVAVDVPSVGVDMPTVAVDTPSVAEGVPSVVAAAPLVAAVMVAGAVRFHDQLNVLAADSARCRPWRFQSRGQMAK